MDFPRSSIHEDNMGIPEDLRCKRSDGKQWRCSALSMPDKTVCEKHYIQAKKRAANSALRASMKKAKRKPVSKEHVILDNRAEEIDLALANAKCEEVCSPLRSKKYKEKGPKRKALYSPEHHSARSVHMHNQLLSDEPLRAVNMDDIDISRSVYRATPSMSSSSKSLTPEDSYDVSVRDRSSRSSDYSGEVGGQTCHQCQKNRMDVTWCQKCNRRGYCSACVLRWYPSIPLKEVQQACPACRGTCNCKVCFNPDALMKTVIREMHSRDKLQLLHGLLSLILPAIQQIHSQQSVELELEMKIQGGRINIPRVKMHADEQMCCDYCKVPIVDYHRHCSDCLYDLCLMCCNDLRQAAVVAESSAETEDKGNGDGGHEHQNEFTHLFPEWRVDSSGNIPCPPREAGGCGCQMLSLRRIFKMNWVANLAKNADEIIRGCRTQNDDHATACLSCSGALSGKDSCATQAKVAQAADREGSDDNFLYCPTPTDIKHEGIGHFQKHWRRGEPVIVKDILDVSTYRWDPVVFWNGIQESVDENTDDENNVVKAVDCLDESEVNIEFGQFVKGFLEGKVYIDGSPRMLALKDWPPPTSLEEFLYYQRPQFMSKFPLLMYIHPKWGFLNLAAKLPHDSMQNDMGTKLFIAYGMPEELVEGNSVVNLHVKMSDVVYCLLHTPEGSEETKHYGGSAADQRSEEMDSFAVADTSISESSPEESRKFFHSASDDDHNEVKCYMSPKPSYAFGYKSHGDAKHDGVDRSSRSRPNRRMDEKTDGGVLWIVFRRCDIPKLKKYLEHHWLDFDGPARLLERSSCSTVLFDQAVFLDSGHMEKLKKEFNVEPWVVHQHVGEAVFVPAGCPFQTRNLQPCVQLNLEFLSADSLEGSLQLSHDLRCLPNDHAAKLQILEVGKMCLYSASSAIREIHKLVLDPRNGAELGVEDSTLTALVSENIVKMVKWRKISCA